METTSMRLHGAWGLLRVWNLGFGFGVQGFGVGIEGLSMHV